MSHSRPACRGVTQFCEASHNKMFKLLRRTKPRALGFPAVQLARVSASTFAAHGFVRCCSWQRDAPKRSAQYNHHTPALLSHALGRSYRLRLVVLLVLLLAVLSLFSWHGERYMCLRTRKYVILQEGTSCHQNLFAVRFSIPAGIQF